jgi:hypothetical protein
MKNKELTTQNAVMYKKNKWHCFLYRDWKRILVLPKVLMSSAISVQIDRCSMTDCISEVLQNKFTIRQGPSHWQTGVVIRPRYIYAVLWKARKVSYQQTTLCYDVTATRHSRT